MTANLAMTPCAPVNVIVKALERLTPPLQRDLEELPHLLLSPRGVQGFCANALKRISRILEEKLCEAYPEYDYVQGKLPTTGGTSWATFPLDGWENFTNGLLDFSLVVALFEGAHVEACVFYFPAQDTFLWGQRDRGAFCNGRRLRRQDQKKNGLWDAWGPDPLPAMNPAWSTHDLRRNGCFSTSLLHFLTGRADFFLFHETISPLLKTLGDFLVHESLGKVSSLPAPTGTWGIYSSEALWPSLMKESS